MLSRLAHTLSRRTRLAHRIALVASSITDLTTQLLTASSTPVQRREESNQSRIGFIFSGQGAQYAEMGRELLQSHPTFFRALERARAHLARLGCCWDLVSELCRPKASSRINEPAFSQPLSTAVQLGLVDLLAEFGIVPSSVVGHSSGEIAAAYAAGILSYEDAMATAYFRGLKAGELLSGTSAPRGAMLAVGAEPAFVEEHIAKISSILGRVRIACFNSPASVTVSGDEAAIDQLREMLEAEGTFNRKLMTNGAAYHSHQMELITETYAESLKALRPNPTRSSFSVRMISSVTGTEVGAQTVLDADYWVRNLLSPVLFTHAVQVMCEQHNDDGRIDTIVEVGPHSQLEGPVKQILKKLPGDLSKIAYTHTLKRGSNTEESFAQCLGFLHTQGTPVRLEELNNKTSNGKSTPDRPLPLVDLPPYAFDHGRTFWHESRVSKDYRHRRHTPHELLGTLSADVNRVEPRWRRFLSLKEIPWLQQHVIQGQIVFPAAGYLTMAVQAARQHTLEVSPTSRVSAISFRNISIGNALVLAGDAADVEITLSLRPQARTARESSAVWNEFRIFSVTTDGKWTEHCRGLLRVDKDEERAEDGGWWASDEDVSRVATRCGQRTAVHEFYSLASKAGLDWRHPFDNLNGIQHSNNGDACVTSACAPSEASSPGGMGDVLHPAVLDSVLFHGLCYSSMLRRGSRTAVVPTFIKELRIANRSTLPGTEFFATTTTCPEGPAYDVVVQDKGTSGNTMLLQARGVRITSLPGDVSAGKQPSRELCHKLEWVTYMDSWTPRHRELVFKKSLEPGSVVELNHHFNAMTLHHVQRALQEVTVGDIPDGSYFRRMFEWMQTVAGQPYDLTLLPQSDGAALNYGVVGEAISRLGPQLSDILTLKTDPLSVLMNDNLLSRLYTEERCSRCYSQMAAWAREFGRHSPGLHVLEVGAGTGSTALPLLEAIHGNVSRYDFTDLSPGFFEGAKKRLGDLADAVHFRVLDIEKDAVQQGFEEASYDLIIASNVVHAIPHIDDALHGIRSLLKPGGKFMLLELTSDMAFINLIFGVFEGWWAGYDEGRRLSPLLAPPQWVDRLGKAGFVDAEPWFADYEAAEGGIMTVFISSAPPLPLVQGPLSLIHLLTTDKEYGKAGAPVTSDKVALLQRSLGGKATAVAVQCPAMPPSGGDIVVVLPEIARLLSDDVDEDSWQGFKSWVLSARVVLFISQGSGVELSDLGSGLWAGFVRCLRLEHPEIRMVTLDLAHTNIPLLEKLAQILPALLDSPTFDLNEESRKVETEFAEKDGQLFVSRLLPQTDVISYLCRNSQQAEPELAPFLNNGRTLSAELAIPGLLETLRWKDSANAPILGPDDVRIELRAASINFKDVLIAAGQLEGITEMRNDCSGVVVDVGANMSHCFKPGDRVCALYSQSYTNYPVVHGDCCQVVPDTISFGEAASLPIVWTTVYYSLVVIGRLASGEKILIHSAAGAVGQAAIILAQHIGAEIFATAGSSAKRELLQNTYGIPADHIFSSRGTAFSERIKRVTGGYGVDVVLNSLSGEPFRVSCDLVAPFGRFVEIGRKDLMDDALMPMEFLLRNVTFAYVDLAAVIDQNKPLARRLLRTVVDLVAAGSIRPVMLTTMPISEIETAFRMIQAGKHTGKVILTVEDGQKVKVSTENTRIPRVSTDNVTKAVPPTPTPAKLRADATYVVVGGFGGLGRAVMSWMADHGAQNILSLSRSGAKGQQSASFIQEMHEAGVRVVGKACDITCEEQVANILQGMELQDRLPPVRGVVQSAMVLRDTLFVDMSVGDWNAALAPKVRGTLNLDKICGVTLDFFIILSSTVAICGNLGQSNYAAACAFQDALARKRVADGRTAYSINVGAVVEAGYVSENPEVADALRRMGLGSISVADLLAVVNHGVMHPSMGGCAVGVVPEGDGLSESIWMRDLRFSHLLQHRRTVQRSDGGSADVGTLLGAAECFEDAVGVVCTAIIQQLATIIATPVETLSAARSLDSYGVDSLVSVELRNWIGTHLQANVPLMTLRGTGSITELANIVAKESRLVNLGSS